MDRHTNSAGSSTDHSEPAWYCLRSQPMHEHIAAAYLRRMNGVIVFCPRIRFKRQTRQGLAWVTEAMFPSYLFAHFALAEMQRQVEYTHGVRGIVRFANRYPTIEEDVLSQLRDRVGTKDVEELQYIPSQGDYVRIGEGAFAGMEAVVTQILPAKERVRVLMDLLGRKIQTELRQSSILRQTEEPASLVRCRSEALTEVESRSQSA